jgi:preprotein translocase subunit SecA
MIREDTNDVVFRVADGKWNAVITEIERMHKTGRPVLVGTTSVESSELVSDKLLEAGIPHEVRLCSMFAVYYVCCVLCLLCTMFGSDPNSCQV